MSGEAKDSKHDYDSACEVIAQKWTRSIVLALRFPFLRWQLVFHWESRRLKKIGLKILRTESLFHSLSSFRRQSKEMICELTGRTEIEDCSCLNSIRVMSYCFHLMDCSFTWVKISYSTDGIRWFNCETYYFYLLLIPSQNHSVCY